MAADDERPRSVTLALILAQIEVVLEKLAEFKAELGEHQERIRVLETESARMKERVGLIAAALVFCQLIGSALVGVLMR